MYNLDILYHLNLHEWWQLSPHQCIIMICDDGNSSGNSKRGEMLAALKSFLRNDPPFCLWIISRNWRGATRALLLNSLDLCNTGRSQLAQNQPLVEAREIGHQTWTALGEIIADRERYTVQSPKFMLTVVCNPIGFHVLKAPRRGANSVHNIILLYKWYLGRNLRLETADRENTAERVVYEFW
jgi:hypothetical protein